MLHSNENNVAMKLLLFGWGRVGCFRLNFDDLSFLPDIFVQGLVKRMGGECGGVSQNDEFHAGSGDGHVHAAQVIQESNVSLAVGPYETD